MAKAAKSASGGYNGKQVDGFLKRIMIAHDEIDELTGQHMNRCGKIRKRIASVVEEARAYGIPKGAMKLQIEVELAKRKLRKRKNELESEIEIEARLVAEARDDQIQMSLFNWTRDNKPTKAKVKAARAKIGKAEDGSDLTANGKPPVGVSGTDLQEAIH